MRAADYLWSERTQSDIKREMLEGHTVNGPASNNQVPRKQRCLQAALPAGFRLARVGLPKRFEQVPRNCGLANAVLAINFLVTVLSLGSV